MAEVAPGEIPIRPIGHLNRKARASTKRPDAPTGQGSTEPEGPPDSERALHRGHQQILVQAPEGPESVPRIVYVFVRESTEGYNN